MLNLMAQRHGNQNLPGAFRIDILQSIRKKADPDVFTVRARLKAVVDNGVQVLGVAVIKAGQHHANRTMHSLRRQPFLIPGQVPLELGLGLFNCGILYGIDRIFGFGFRHFARSFFDFFANSKICRSPCCLSPFSCLLFVCKNSKKYQKTYGKFFQKSRASIKKQVPC